MARFLDACWRGAVGNADPIRIETRCFRVRRGGREIVDRHVVTRFGGTARLSSGVTIYRWDVHAQRFRYEERGSDGTRRSGIAWATPSTVIFEDDHPIMQGGMARRTRWLFRPGELSWEVIVELERVDHPIVLWEAQMSRVEPAPRR
jgi:hypothetical protein